MGFTNIVHHIFFHFTCVLELILHQRWLNVKLKDELDRSVGCINLQLGLILSDLS